MSCRRAALLLAVSCLVACGGTQHDADPRSTVTELETLAPLEAAFNDDSGHVRVIVLLSPT